MIVYPRTLQKGSAEKAFKKLAEAYDVLCYRINVNIGKEGVAPHANAMSCAEAEAMFRIPLFTKRLWP